MMTRTMTMRRKIAASVASAALAMSMVVVAPTLALADGTVAVEPSSADQLCCDMGSSLGMADKFSYDLPSGAHVDYAVTNGTGTATINKHSGALSAISAGNVTVTAYVTTGTRGNGSSSVCGGDDAVVGSGSRTVSINAVQASDYGYQGGQLQIRMDTPVVTATSSATDADGVVTITNTVPAQSAGSTVTFTYHQNAGLNQYTQFYQSPWGYTSPELAYKALAGQHIKYVDANGNTTYLSAANDGQMNVLSVDSSNGTVTLSVNVGAAASTGTSIGKLVFESDLHTFQRSNTAIANKSLSKNIVFEMNVVSAGGGSDV